MSTAFFLALPLACFALAEADLSPLGGASGWAGAGLLSLMLGWLCLKYLPAQDARLDKHQTEERALMRDLNQQLATTVTNLVGKFDEAQTRAAERCEAERRETRAYFQKILDEHAGQKPRQP